MPNPFLSGANPHDIPMSDVERAKTAPAGTGTSGDQHAMRYDPETQTGSPAFAAFIKELDRREDKLAKAMIRSVARELSPMAKRIRQLEKALDVEREKVADAIRATALDDTDDEATRVVKKAMADNPAAYGEKHD